MMKKLVVMIGCVLGLVMSGCSSDTVGTYYPDYPQCPDYNTMQQNLEEEGYEVIVTDQVEGDYTGTYLSAIKDDDYIEFYWLDDAEDVKEVSDALKTRHNGYGECDSTEEDSATGPYVFSSTPGAMKSAGISEKH